jgi:uncharacterized protein YdhG (YjbR/CyaY superfamily)
VSGDFAAVDSYLAGQPEPQQSTLVAMRATLRSLLPKADEAIKYGMPAFVVKGTAVAGYAGFSQHCSYFPHSGEVLGRAGDLIAGYETSKGGLRFTADRPLPKPLVKRLVRLRLDELGAVTEGRRIECHGDGTVKAEGPVKAGALHGDWRWYRKDGTLMRTGSFRHGERTGTWQSYDAHGDVVTTKRY